jgi:hypothetical protein
MIEDQGELSVLVSEDDRDRGWYHLRGHFVRIVYEDGKRTIRNGVGDSEYASLVINSQGDNDRTYWNKDTGPRLYGEDIFYLERYSVRLRDAESMVKLLRRIDRAMRKFAESEGYVTDFADYFGRICRALKIKTVVFPRRILGSSYSENEYDYKSVGDAVNTLRWMESMWADKLTKVAAESVA